MSVLFRLLSPAVVALVMLSCVSQVATASIEVNHNLFVVLEDGSTVTGMFAGDTGADDIITTSEVTSWMFDYANSPTLLPFSLSSVAGDSLDVFHYDLSEGPFPTTFELAVLSPFLSAPLIFYSPQDPSPWFIVDPIPSIYSPPGSFVPTITPKVSGQIPEPSSMLVWGGLLISVVGIGRKRNR